MKIIPVGAELFFTDEQMDGRTDMTKLIIAFRNFANPPSYLVLLRGDFSVYLLFWRDRPIQIKSFNLIVTM
jgi:hypothetical protein